MRKRKPRRALPTRSQAKPTEHTQMHEHDTKRRQIKVQCFFPNNRERKRHGDVGTSRHLSVVKRMLIIDSLAKRRQSHHLQPHEHTTSYNYCSDCSYQKISLSLDTARRVYTQVKQTTRKTDVAHNMSSCSDSPAGHSFANIITKNVGASKNTAMGPDRTHANKIAQLHSLNHHPQTDSRRAHNNAKAYWPNHRGRCDQQ